MNKKEHGKLSHEEFFKIAILRLRDMSRSRGIHSVFSGFNQAFREYFGDDPIKVTQELARLGKVEIRPVRGGVMIYLPGEAPQSRRDLGKEVLKKIFNQSSEYDKGLIEKVLREVISEDIKKFPEDFLVGCKEDEMLEMKIPGTPLDIDSNSKTTLFHQKGISVMKQKIHQKQNTLFMPIRLDKKRLKYQKIIGFYLKL